MEEALCFESELEHMLIEQSKKQFGVMNEDTLLPYLLRRCFILEIRNNQLPKINKDDFSKTFMNYWLKDLAIPIHNESFIYKDTLIPTSTSYGSVFSNIYESLHYQLSTFLLLSSDTHNNKSIIDLAREDVNAWLKAAKTQSKKYRNQTVYPYILKQKVLSFLNESYQAKVKPPESIDYIGYKDIVYQLNEEELCDRYITAFNERVTDGRLIEEDELEKFILRNLNQLEDGLRPVKAQYILPKGRIDILAKDKDEGYVIVELKVEKDTDIVWQKWYYVTQIKKKYNTDNVRFIVVLPQIYPEIIEPLFEDSTPTKIIQYHPVIKRGEIQEATFTEHRAS